MAIRMGAFPNLNSAKNQRGEHVQSHDVKLKTLQLTGDKKNIRLTIKNPVSLLLTLVSMDAHSRPPEKRRIDYRLCFSTDYQAAELAASVVKHVDKHTHLSSSSG